ncbi:hypothetical protein GHK92_09260 [Nocardioides sp. dk4132]|uniref:hypothetical protein n=1 Tax=unclassified Nocardioides TaxID=2615069 RepID=UPI001294F39B|nr:MULTISPECIES: hypothetical protein [unclassified Nocardioides]MQW76062.1 hypothetical protein [Nocardioides sp. dk4132]QGA08912.1 hypothetical protein GFH29_17020 [Nocardioides sp. dk884]
MESIDREALREAHRAAERAEAAPYIDYPPTPAWYPPAMGAWATAYTLLLTLWEDHGWWLVLGMIGLAALTGLFLGWYSHHHGAVPNLRHAPREFRSAFACYAVVVVSIVGSIALSWWLVGPALAAPVAFVATVVGLVVYERAFASSARRTRQRLA